MRRTQFHTCQDFQIKCVFVQRLKTCMTLILKSIYIITSQCTYILMALLNQIAQSWLTNSVHTSRSISIHRCIAHCRNCNIIRNVYILIKLKIFLAKCRLIFCNYLVFVSINRENKFFCRWGFKDEYTVVQWAVTDMSYLPYFNRSSC